MLFQVANVCAFQVFIDGLAAFVIARKKLSDVRCLDLLLIMMRSSNTIRLDFHIDVTLIALLSTNKPPCIDQLA
jgi:hypothetical protein